VKATVANAILVVDDDDDILTRARLLLKRHFERVSRPRQPGAIPALIGRPRSTRCCST
jgi:hypothetical protein